jgi:hypothetical protein
MKSFEHDALRLDVFVSKRIAPRSALSLCYAERTRVPISSRNERRQYSVISSRGPMTRPAVRRSPMHFTLSHDAIPPDRPADAAEPRAARHRASTSATLVAVALCAIFAKGHLLEARPQTSDAMARNNVAPPTKIVAPEFCKDQTWPYIDSRCLRRVDAAPPADAPKVVAPPAAAAAVAPSSPDSAATSTAAASPAAAPPVAASPAPAAPDARARVIQSVFPQAPSASPDSNGQASANATTDIPTYQRTSDSAPRRRSRHWNNHGFLGFRF